MTARALRRCCIAAAAATACGALPAAGAHAADFGSATITLDGPAYRALHAQGLRAAASGRARVANRRITLPVSAGLVTSTAVLDHAGTLVLRVRDGGRTRSLRLTRIQLRLNRIQSTLSARVAGRRQTIFTVAKHPTLDARAKTARLSQGRLVLTRTAAATIRRELRVRRLAQRTLGTLSVRATVLSAPAPSVPATGSTGAGPAPPSAPGDATALPAPPPTLARPATAVPITNATVTWHVRDSFIQYISGGGGGATASAGATAAAPEVRPGSPIALVYAFGFTPAATGWYDPPTATAAVSFTGTVRFRYPGRFDFTASDAELELNGGASRAIFRFNGQGVTTYDNRRGVLVDLAPLPAPAVSPDGRTRTYASLPGVIPAGAASSIFADFYVPGDAFGSFALSFST